jgi:hypothetical protein
VLDRDGRLLLHPVVGELARPEERLGPLGVDPALLFYYHSRRANKEDRVSTQCSGRAY